MKLNTKVGIFGYGAYIPSQVLETKSIADIWQRPFTPVKAKRFAYMDEDAVTIAYEAARIAIEASGVPREKIGAIFVGSESKPYAVKPSGTILADALGIPRTTLAADFEFACKAGTEAIQTLIGLVSSGMIEYGLAIGADTAQGRPGDDLEFTAAAGGAAYIISSVDKGVLGVIEASVSYVSDTPDFWRRSGEKYPRHLHRFTGEPAYFAHTIGAVRLLFEKYGYSPSDFDYAVFHQPNAKFPQRVASILGFRKEQIAPGLLSPLIGNAYAASSLLGLAATLDVAKPGERILLASFGSGAGSDAFSILVTDLIEERRPKRRVRDYIGRGVMRDYSLYAKSMDKLFT
ncbi:hydroxymethylglutaryl-CoA synthase [Candidatus Geothermarchaeota archaeon ex4572_27]|nr:MAG: hydroxymethylglutaryl-CoA synthase [Candidatus Geothermarchaeota archaeon ex4572_27]